MAVGYPSVVVSTTSSRRYPLGEGDVMRSPSSGQHDSPVMDPPLPAIWPCFGGTMDGSSGCSCCAIISLAYLLA